MSISQKNVSHRIVRGLWHRVGVALGALALVLVTATPSQAQSLTATLDSARAARDRGALDRATTLYQSVLRTDSTSRPALRELADVLSAQGKWQAALPLVQRLSDLGVANVTVERDLGQWLSWLGETEKGLVHLRRAVALAPDADTLRLSLGRALTWSSQTRAEGLTTLRDLVRERPAFFEARHSLASALTWDPTTRAEGMRLLSVLVRENPSSNELVTEYADVLSWIQESRGEAMQLYERVASRDPGNLAAARGRLNVLTWSGRTREALRLADSLLLRTPNDSVLLLGRGNLLVALGRPADAVAVLRPQLARTPGNTQLAEQLAYALLASGEFAEARQVASRIAETTYPSAPDWVRRGAAPAIGIDASFTNTSLGLSLARALATASYPVAAGTRVAITGGPTRFVSGNDRFVSGSVAASIERRSPRITLARLEAGAERYPDAPTSWSGAAEIERSLQGRAYLRLFARRTPVEDSRRAASGLTENGQFVGQVRANVAGLSIRVPSIGAGFTVNGSVAAGVNSGRSLENNTRREASLTLTRGFGLGASAARVELGTGISYLDFEFDANQRDPGTPTARFGGYWSPDDFSNAFVSAGLIVPITGRLTWRTDGAVGQLVSSRQGAPNANSFNATTDLRWTGRRGWDANAGFFYLDNLGGFRLQQGRLGIRHAF